LLAQAGDENRWPIFMVPYLHRDNRARRKRIDLRSESSRALFNLTEAARDFAGRLENRSTISFLRQRPLPCDQEWIARFHRLHEPPCTDTFRAPLKE
jgi:hypothetical protein